MNLLPTDLLTPDELALFANYPETDLVDLAADLDMAVPETINRGEILVHAIVSIAQIARTEGLPLSRFDRADLEALPPELLQALARLCGTDPTVKALLKLGAKVYKTYRKQRPHSQVPMVLPMLLPALARYALRTEG